MIIKGLNFIKLCGACPEQYDVQDSNGNRAGYICLQHGKLYCDYPDIGGETIYSTYFNNERMGCFNDKDQRQFYLNDIADKLLEKINKNSQ